LLTPGSADPAVVDRRPASYGVDFCRVSVWGG